MKLQFCTLDGQRSERDVAESMMVSDLKDELYACLSLDVVADMKLFHGTIEWTSEKVIADFGALEGDTIQVVLQRKTFARAQKLLSALGFPGDIIQIGRELAARTKEQAQESEQAELGELAPDIPSIEPLQLPTLQDASQTRFSHAARGGIATFDMVSRFVAVLEYFSRNLKPHTSRTITTQLVASAGSMTGSGVRAELIFLSLPFSRALLTACQTCKLKLPPVQLDKMDYPHSISPAHLGACIDFMGRCGTHHLMQLAASCSGSELAELASSSALTNADVKSATEKLLGQLKTAHQDGLEQVLACIDRIAGAEEQLKVLMAVNAAIVTCTERASMSLQVARKKIVSKIAASGGRQLPQELLVEVPCEVSMWPNDDMSAVNVVDSRTNLCYDVAMMERMVPMGMPLQRTGSDMHGMCMFTRAGASMMGLQSAPKRPRTRPQAVQRDLDREVAFLAQHEALLEAHQALLAEHQALQMKHSSLLAASDQPSRKEEEQGGASDPVALGSSSSSMGRSCQSAPSRLDSGSVDV